MHLDPAAGPVFADASQMRQVVMNLVLNARDAMPGGGRLEIETSNVEVDAGYGERHLGMAQGTYVLITVSDTTVIKCCTREER